MSKGVLNGENGGSGECPWMGWVVVVSTCVRVCVQLPPARRSGEQGTVRGWQFLSSCHLNEWFVAYNKHGGRAT